MKDTEKNKEIELDTSGTECPIPVLKARKLAQEIPDVDGSPTIAAFSCQFCVSSQTCSQPNILFTTIKDIEKKLGRKKSKINNPRTCDIDILDYKGLIYKLHVNNDKLSIPHPRLHNRNFVLFPLFEIEKNWKHPLKKTKIQDLIGKLDNSSLYSIKQI